MLFRSPVSIASGATLWLNTPNGASFANSVTNAGLVDFMQAGSLSVSGTIAGTGSITQSGTGFTTLTAVNTYTGPTSLTAGALQIGDGNTGSIAAVSPVSIASGSTLWLNTPNGASFANSVTNAGLVDFMQAGSLSVSGTIAGTGSITQSGTGFTTQIGRAHV